MLKANLERDGLDLTFDTDLVHLDVTTRVVSIGTASPSGNYTFQIDGNMHVNSTDAILLPSGTTAEQVDVEGKLRYNTDDNIIEWYNGSGWIQPGIPNPITVLDDTSTAISPVDTFEFGNNLDVTDLGDGHVLVDATGGSSDPLTRRGANLNQTASTNLGAVLPASCYVDRITISVLTGYDNNADLIVTAASGITSLVAAGAVNMTVIGINVVHLGMEGTSAGQVVASITNSPSVGNCTVTVHYKIII